jgi:hypothetical protein
MKEILGCRLWGITVFVFLLTGIYACQQTQISSTARPYAANIKKISIARFQDMSEAYGQNNQVRSPINGEVFLTGPVAQEGPRLLADRSHNFLKTYSRFQLLPRGHTKGVISRLTMDTPYVYSPKQLLLEAGRELDTDAILSGHVYRYRRRVGNAYSVETPASVAFDIFLLRVRDGSMVWSGRFDETQTSLDENLFNLKSFIRRKGRWITAEEMATYGLEELLNVFVSQ